MWSFRDPECQRLYNYQQVALKLEAEKIMGRNPNGPDMGLKVARVTSGHTLLVRTQ